MLLKLSLHVENSGQRCALEVILLFVKVSGNVGLFVLGDFVCDLSYITKVFL